MHCCDAFYQSQRWLSYKFDIMMSSRSLQVCCLVVVVLVFTLVGALVLLGIDLLDESLSPDLLLVDSSATPDNRNDTAAASS